ncbi:interleukin-6 receptor subunit beta isoform X1 [Nothobranchius furzeri]|uniref:interleukin-6 receptor subunit beta isoform X1 n=1 Tax=Nothobranchius furzeri TaxID=105023 RepID=UPI00077CE79D
MERRSAAVWIFVLGARLALASEAFPQPPRLIGCVFIMRRNVTCCWEPGDTSVITNYTLQVQRNTNSLKTFTCTTSSSRCTANLDGSSVRFEFCVTIVAHYENGDVRSKSRCQSGRKEVILPPVILSSVKQVHGAPKCLNIHWNRDLSSFPVSDREIEAGNLNSQIEITTREQVDVQIMNVTVTGYSLMVCFFRPDTSYVIRLRNRYQGPESPWSSWSNALQGRTAEDAPSAAPILWRKVENTNRNGSRLISLLWKPLPQFLANGKIVCYNVTCRTKDAQVISDHGSCTDLQNADAFCSLSLPAGCYSCSLTASTSAGESPEARIWIPDSSKTVLPPPSHVTATPLSESSLEVHWTAPCNRSVSGFVVEWFSVREKNSSILYWEKVNTSSTKLLITGVKPMEQYAVSVKALYENEEAGENRTLRVYTREGPPSAGPHVKVQNINGFSVELSWTPPPVEFLHGFISNYTLFYSSRHHPAKSVVVPGHVCRHTLKNMSPGIYDIFMKASTVAGTSPAGNLANVLIGSEEMSIVTYVLVPIVLMATVLMLVACLAQTQMVKQKLSLGIPDPSNSTLSHWNPDTSLDTKRLVVVQAKPEDDYSDIILLDKLQDLDKNRSCLLLSRPHSYFPLLSSSPPLKTSDQLFTRNRTEEEGISSSNFSMNIYSNISDCQPPQTTLLPLYKHQFFGSPTTIYSNDIKFPANEASESLVFQLSPSEQTSVPLFPEDLQSGVSLPDLSRASRSSQPPKLCTVAKERFCR